jgi:MerR family mercuric resistance operon transcriptional regulator
MMKIGEIASQSDLNVQTIRFYEREGLLRKPARTASGYRSYEPHDLERVRFIRACQGLGFTLREVKQLIRLHQVNASQAHTSMTPESIGRILSLAQERVTAIEEKMESLSRMRSEMQRLIRELSADSSPRCPASPAVPQRRQ